MQGLFWYFLNYLRTLVRGLRCSRGWFVRNDFAACTLVYFFHQVSILLSLFLSLPLVHILTRHVLLLLWIPSSLLTSTTKQQGIVDMDPFRQWTVPNGWNTSNLHWSRNLNTNIVQTDLNQWYTSIQNFSQRTCWEETSSESSVSTLINLHVS
jgi:hypothetical protein